MSDCLSEQSDCLRYPTQKEIQCAYNLGKVYLRTIGSDAGEGHSGPPKDIFAIMTTLKVGLSLQDFTVNYLSRVLKDYGFASKEDGLILYVEDSNLKNSVRVVLWSERLKAEEYSDLILVLGQEEE